MAETQSKVSKKDLAGVASSILEMKDAIEKTRGLPNSKFAFFVLGYENEDGMTFAGASHHDELTVLQTVESIEAVIKSLEAVREDISRKSTIV